MPQLSDLQINPVIQQSPEDYLPVRKGQYIQDIFTDNMELNPITGQLRKFLEGKDRNDPLIPAAEANKLYGIEGALQFDGPVSHRRAEAMRKSKESEIARQDRISRYDASALDAVQAFGVGMAATMLDPLNIGLVFVPELAFARLGRATSPLARLGRVAAEGALEGAVSGGVTFGLAQQNQYDYSASDFLMDVAFGTALSTTFAGVGMATEGAIRRGRIAAQDHAHATRAAIGQLADGRRVDVEGVLRLSEVNRVEELGGSRVVRNFDLEGPPVDHSRFMHTIDTLDDGGARVEFTDGPYRVTVEGERAEAFVADIQELRAQSANPAIQESVIQNRIRQELEELLPEPPKALTEAEVRKLDKEEQTLERAYRQANELEIDDVIEDAIRQSPDQETAVRKASENSLALEGLPTAEKVALLDGVQKKTRVTYGSEGPTPTAYREKAPVTQEAKDQVVATGKKLSSLDSDELVDIELSVEAEKALKERSLDADDAAVEEDLEALLAEVELLERNGLLDEAALAELRAIEEAAGETEALGAAFRQAVSCSFREAT